MRRAPLAFLLLLLASVIAGFGAESARTLALTLDPAAGAPARHGVEKLTAALRARGWAVEPLASPTAPRAATGAALVARLDPTAPAESLALRKSAASTSATTGPRIVLDLTAGDDRGLMYALLDLAERVSWARDAADLFSEVRDTREQPALRERSLSAYASHRATWEKRFYDERYWTRYFDTLAANCFNRWVLVLGYESGGFLAPAFPYFFPTPGFADVRMRDLSPAQQRANLAALNRIVALARARGIAVTLGLWDHTGHGATPAGGADWLDAFKDQPIPNSVAGLTAENLRAYTLASLQELLARVPGFDGLQLRLGDKSGIATVDTARVWSEALREVQRLKPGLSIEVLGDDAAVEALASAPGTGTSLSIAADLWSGQMGLPYAQPSGPALPRPATMWRLGNGGTARVLLSGDPDHARRTVENVRRLGGTGLEIQEPLATKMAGQRPDAPTFDLMPSRYRDYEYEFERYWLFLRLWGRLGYDPATPPEVWWHEFGRRFGPAAAPHLEAGLARASQVLPMVVASSSYPVAALPPERGWPERQTLGDLLDSYAKNQGTDRAQFETSEEASRRILAEGTTTQRTPDATVRWLHATADDILKSVRAAEAAAGHQRSREFEATVTDLKILAQLARFHAYRSIAALHYNLFKRGLRLAELLKATYDTREVVAAWRELVAVAGDRYHHDLAFGARSHRLAGHWRDELAPLEYDLKDLEAQCCPPDEALAKEKTWLPPTTGDLTAPAVEHTRVTTARPGQPLRLVARVTDPAGVKSVALRHRHLAASASDFATLDMQPTGQPDEYAATLPGDFFAPGQPVLYFLSVTDRAGNGANWPAFAVETPYIVVTPSAPR